MGGVIALFTILILFTTVFIWKSVFSFEDRIEEKIIGGILAFILLSFLWGYTVSHYDKLVLCFTNFHPIQAIIDIWFLFFGRL